MSKRMNSKEKWRGILIAWLYRHRTDYPDGFSGEALAQREVWECARYDGVLWLKKPEHAKIVAIPGKEERTVAVPVENEKQIKALALVPGARVVGESHTYSKRIGSARRSWNDPERVPPAFHRASRTSRFLSSLARDGALELVPRSKPKRYVFPSKRLVFGVDCVEGPREYKAS